MSFTFNCFWFELVTEKFFDKWKNKFLFCKKTKRFFDANVDTKLDIIHFGKLVLVIDFDWMKKNEFEFNTFCPKIRCVLFLVFFSIEIWILETSIQNNPMHILVCSHLSSSLSSRKPQRRFRISIWKLVSKRNFQSTKRLVRGDE